MEAVTVMVYYEGLSSARTKRYGASYVRANGEPVDITNGQTASGIALEKAKIAVPDCDWERFRADGVLPNCDWERLSFCKDAVMHVGDGWIDPPDVV